MQGATILYWKIETRSLEQIVLLLPEQQYVVFSPAGEVLARTRDNHWFFAFYVLFVLAVAVHAPIGLRNVLREWTRWHGRSLDVALALFAALLLILGVRAALAVYVSPERLFG